MKEIAKNVLYKILTLSLYLARKKQGYTVLYKSLNKPDLLANDCDGNWIIDQIFPVKK